MSNSFHNLLLPANKVVGRYYFQLCLSMSGERSPMCPFPGCIRPHHTGTSTPHTHKKNHSYVLVCKINVDIPDCGGDPCYAYFYDTLVVVITQVVRSTCNLLYLVENLREIIGDVAVFEGKKVSCLREISPIQHLVE